MQTNLVVDYYIGYLKETLAANRPSLHDVVSYAGSESYDAHYYPTGWGLVYFLRNYEDESFERVYSPIYDRYLDSYRTGGKHDRFERFLEYFVTGAKQDGVSSFADFEGRFKAWIVALHRRWTAGPEVCSELLELARRRRAAGKLDAAIDAYRWALSKRPESLAAAIELGDVLDSMGRKDAAITTCRRVVEVVRFGDPGRVVADLEETSAQEVANRALATIVKIDRTFAGLVEEANNALAASARALATAYAEADCPDNAAWALSVAARLLGSPMDLVNDRDTLVREKGAEWRRRVRLSVTPDLDLWRPIGSWSAKAGVLSATDQLLALVEYGDEMPDSYRFEVTARMVRAGDHGWMGLVFGIGDDGVWDALGVYSNGTATLERCSKEFVSLRRFPDLPDGPVKDVRLAVDVERGSATFWVDGTKVGALDMGANALQGRIGLACSDGSFEFLDPVIRIQ